MSTLLLCLATVAFAYAAPPIVPAKPESVEHVPRKPEPVEHALSPQADTSPCVDGVNNVVQIADIKKR